MICMFCRFKNKKNRKATDAGKIKNLAEEDKIKWINVYNDLYLDKDSWVWCFASGNFKRIGKKEQKNRSILM